MKRLITPSKAVEIGRRIRTRREFFGLSQRDLEVEGVSYAYISRLERGDRVPSLSALIGLAKKLHMTALELLTGDPEADCPFCGRKGLKP